MTIRFKPEIPADGSVLCLGAHCDDIEIGCGGTLIELRRRHPGLRIAWVVFTGDAVREAETRAAASALLGDSADFSLDVHHFKTGYLPYLGGDIKDAFESLRTRIDPHLVMTHYLADRHQDHRVVAELTWNTFRSHPILEYEIPKYDGDLGQPGMYCPLPQSAVDLKVETLMTHFPSQRDRQWFDADLFRGHLRLRGVECNSSSRYAEAFHARKITF